MTGVSALVLALDYDGTLVPFADAPDLAVPDAELLDLLAHLAAIGQASEIH
jgi:trehalose-6-phosphatase